MLKTKKHAAYITVDGVDGVGKTTICKMLVEALESDGLRVFLTKQPGDSVLGTKIREILKNDDIELSSEEQLALFLADRLAHNRRIRKLVNSGEYDVIISDRGVLSSVTYQKDAFKELPDVSFDICLLSLFNSDDGVLNFPNKSFVVTASSDNRVVRLKESRQDTIKRFDEMNQEDVDRMQFFMINTAWQEIAKDITTGSLQSFSPDYSVSASLCVLRNDSAIELEQNVMIMQRIITEEVLGNDIER